MPQVDSIPSSFTSSSSSSSTPLTTTPTSSVVRVFDSALSSTSFPLIIKYVLMLVDFLNEVLSLVIRLHLGHPLEDRILVMLAWTLLCFHPFSFWCLWVPYWFPIMQVSTQSRSSDDLTALFQGTKLLKLNAKHVSDTLKHSFTSSNHGGFYFFLFLSFFIFSILGGGGGRFSFSLTPPPHWFLWSLGMVGMCGSQALAHHASILLSWILPSPVRSRCITVWVHWKEKGYLQKGWRKVEGWIHELRWVEDWGVVALKNMIELLIPQSFVSVEDEEVYLSLLSSHFDTFTPTDIYIFSWVETKGKYTISK
ncbi:hypothetical protein HMI54_015564 [Coelomomyces lativittatus]|nr:hypothetical protein HMI56_005087 [Coelomomyces lativittatus]KAJ1512767.1 hypothetical protein HMI55_006117 [Coelomomyces lativittatus]KAJ1518506.1 hypothetical protein HMI54_015564 [Coelomomyces lativittatus]